MAITFSSAARRALTLCSLLLCGGGFFAWSGQTPAPAPATPQKPLRHLEYSFQVSYMRNGETHNSGMSAGGEGGTGAGMSPIFGSAGRRGTIDADVMALTQDDGMIVQINESLQYAPRPEERFTCIVYGDGRSMCPRATGPLSDAENALLSVMGRGFIDPALTDATAHWQRKYDGKDIKVVSEYTMTDPLDGKPATIVKHAKITSDVPSVGDSIEETRISYDRKLSVPDSIHAVLDETLRYATVHTTIELNLTSDSFAAH
jgi:hypothetical protein